MNLANRFSISRLLLTPMFVLSVIYCEKKGVLLSKLPTLVFILAIITDMLDGLVARRLKQVTRLGRILDPVADKVLILTAFVTLFLFSAGEPSLRIPAWILVIVITRDIFILCGACIVYLMLEYIEFRPTLLGKITTLAQMMTILSVLMMFRYSYVVWNVAAILTVASGIHYLLRTNSVITDRYKKHE